MSRSSYATTSALSVACPTCKAPIGRKCILQGLVLQAERKRSHPARRKAADAARTAEVNPQLVRDQ